MQNNNKTIDSYQKIFNDVGVSLDLVIQKALENVIWIEEPSVQIEWESLKDRMRNKAEVFVRNHGRNGSGKDDLLKILSDIFNKDFNIDPSNNNKPSSLLRTCILSKNNLEIQNYQVSHIFEERTNNPYLFTAPWMVCYTPKILDPFTGHESKGYDWVREQFIDAASKKFDKYIIEYNKIIQEYWGKLHTLYNHTQSYDKFQKHMIVTLSPIIIDFEKKSQRERVESYIKEFNKL